MMCHECGEEMVTSVIDCRECFGRGWGCLLCDSSGIEYEFGCLSELCSTSLYGDEGNK